MSNVSRQNKPNQEHQQLDHAIVSRFVDVLEENAKTALRKAELEHKSIDRNAEVAEKAIDASVRATESDNKKEMTKNLQHKIFVAFLAVAGMCFIGWMSSNGYKDIAVLILEKSAFIIGGGLGGYALRASKEDKKKASTYQDIT